MPEDTGDEFAVLLEYDPDVKAAYGDIEPLGEEYAKRFRDQVTADRHKASAVRDALVGEWEAALNKELSVHSLGSECEKSWIIPETMHLGTLAAVRGGLPNRGPPS